MRSGCNIILNSITRTHIYQISLYKIEVLAKFVPNNSTFEIIDTISSPKKQPSQSLRVSKRDKAIAIKERRKLQRKQEAKG